MKPKYKKMLNRMREKEESYGKKRKKDPWYLYILRCNDGSLYTGITKDLERRFQMHQTGKASRYTRTRRPVELLYQETCPSRTQALVRECRVKALPRKKKTALIEGQA